MVWLSWLKSQSLACPVFDFMGMKSTVFTLIRAAPRALRESQSKGRKKCLHRSGSSVTPMTCWSLPPTPEFESTVLPTAATMPTISVSDWLVAGPPSLA